MGASPDIHPTAWIDPTAHIGVGTRVGPNAVIGASVSIGQGCTIGQGAVIGAEPFVLTPPENGLQPIEIADRTFIGANATVQYGVKRPTRIGTGVWVNHNCAIGHDVHLGDGVMVGLSCTISGHSDIAENVRIGPGSSLTNRSSVAAGATIGIGSLVLHPVAANEVVLGRPAQPRAQHLEAEQRLRQILDMDRPSRRITGGARAYARYLPAGVRKLLKRILRRS